MVTKEEHTRFSWEIAAIDVLFTPILYNDPKPSKVATGMIEVGKQRGKV